MNSQDDPLNDGQSDPGLAHRRTWDAIPWLVNGRFSDPERGAAEAHLQTCEDCRAELEFQRRLELGLLAQPESTPAGAGNAEAALRRLWQQIDAEDDLASAAPPVTTTRIPPPVRERRHALRRRHYLPRALAAICVLEAAALLAFAAIGWQQPTATLDAYRTLSSTPATTSSAEIRAVFAPTLTLDELRALLIELNLSVVAGPSEAGVYSLSLIGQHDSASARSALAELRTRPAVRFAEPVGALLADQ